MKEYESFLRDIKNIKSRLYAGNIEPAEKRKLYNHYIDLLAQAADKGSNEAQFQLGQHFEDINYWGVNPDFNPEKCVYWYTKACDNNHAEACNSLAHCYELGSGVEKSLSTALSLYEKSAILGSQLGQDNHQLLKKELNRPPLIQFFYRIMKKILPRD